MNNTLPISIIIPSYNRAEQLAMTLDMYLSLPVEKIILIDDGSSDDTADKYADFKHKKFVYYKNKVNLGLPATRNVGVSIAKTDFILMGEDDVYMDSAYVRNLYSAIIELNADFVAGRMINMNKDETLVEAVARSEIDKPSEGFKHKASLSFNYSCYFPSPVEIPYLHACSLFKKSWAEKYPYSNRYKGNALREESHFYINAFRKGAKIYFCSDASAYHMYHNYGGGCRGSQIKYFYYGVVNTHQFLTLFWTDIKQIFELSSPRFVFELKYVFTLAKSTFKHWLSIYFPGLHSFLKNTFKR